MQRPSFALAVLFGAMASGLLVANVAPCQVIVVFHEVQSEEPADAEESGDVTPAPVEATPSVAAEGPETSVANEGAAVATEPAVTEPAVTEVAVTDVEVTDVEVTEPAVTEVAVTEVEMPVEATEPVSEVAEPAADVAAQVASNVDGWLIEGEADPVDAMPPELPETAEVVRPTEEPATEVQSSPEGLVDEHVTTESAEEPSASEGSLPWDDLSDTERTEDSAAKGNAELVEESGDLVDMPESEPVAEPAAEQPEVDSSIDASAEDGGENLSSETAEGEAAPMSSHESWEPLQDAARDAAVTLENTATWMQSVAAGLRAWAGE